MNPISALCGALAASLLCGGCASVTEETSHAATLSQAMTTDHTAAVALLNRANAAMLPYVMDQAVLPGRTTFAKEDLSVLGPSDIADWDKILAGLDSYCSALSALTSGKNVDSLTTASETFGTNIKALTKATKAKTNTPETAAATALAAIADVLVREKANRDAQAIARQADPAFQKIIADLTTALQGVQQAYETDYTSATMPERLKEFPGDAIAGFDALTTEQRKAKVKEFAAWLTTEQTHDDLILAFTTLSGSLAKLAAAHSALAQGGKADLPSIFADLQAEAQNVSAICQKFTG